MSDSLLTEKAKPITNHSGYSKTGYMEAAILQKPGNFIIKRVPMPVPSPEEVVFEVEGCGICASNIPVFEGRDWYTYPASAGNPGHETWGKVVFVGSEVKKLKKGDRIAALSHRGFALYDKVHAERAIKLPFELQMMEFPGEPLACAMNVFRRSDIRPGQTVAVTGVGFLGAIMIQLAKAAGAKVIALSKRPYSLQMAKKFGADEVITLMDQWKVVEEVKEITSGKLCDRVIEATGKEWPLSISGEIAAERGKLIIAGYHQEGMRQVNMHLWNWKGLDVINAHERDPELHIKGMREAVDAVMSGRINPEPLYSRYSLTEINKAFDGLLNRPDGYMKALIKM